MKNRGTLIFILLFGTIFLLGALYSLYIDSFFFLYKKENFGKILEIEKTKKHDYKTTIEYYNDYLNKRIITTIFLNNHDGALLQRNSRNKNEVKLMYSKKSPYKIYLFEINELKVGIIIFELFGVFLLVIAICFSINNLKK